jgi:alpha-galactosidase
MKPLHDRSLAVVLFNRGVVAAPTAEDFADPGPRANARRRVRDLWQHNDRGVVRGALTMTVPAHGVVMLRLFPARPAP